MAQFRQQLATLSTSGGSHRDLAEKYRQVFKVLQDVLKHCLSVKMDT